nr:hypothetical protein SHINE37_30092 [Rhizobiaceae bacterium]
MQAGYQRFSWNFLDFEPNLTFVSMNDSGDLNRP